MSPEEVIERLNRGEYGRFAVKAPRRGPQPINRASLAHVDYNAPDAPLVAYRLGWPLVEITSKWRISQRTLYYMIDHAGLTRRRNK